MRTMPASVFDARARAAASHLVAYRYKIWGFGEDIGLRGLLELGDELGETAASDFVADTVVSWAHATPPLGPADHVAPGVVLLDVAERRQDPVALERALELGRLLTSFPVADGVAVHRRDLDDWRDTIWVDCMALDGPFLTRLAQVTGDERWADRGTDACLGYARVLQDDSDGLFVHGYDVGTHRPSTVRWGRGNGWALHGLVDTLANLPADHADMSELRARLARLVGGLCERQDASGAWHTVLDDPTSPLEASVAAFFVSAILKARRLRLLGAELVAEIDPAIDRARAVLGDTMGDDGALMVSNATPVGDRATYVDRPLGVFPWGQGPLVLTFVEARRAAVGSPV